MPRLSIRLLTGLVAAAFALAAAPAAHATTAPFPYCSWWLETTPETANVAFPDAAATYWTTPFLASAGTSIQVDGAYPDARYMSFNVYDDSFGTFTLNGVSSGLADYLITPASGSVNPFQTKGSPGGAFTLTLSLDAQPGQVNTLPLAPTTQSTGSLPAPLGYLVYRTYLPNGGNTTVPLPNVTLVQDGVSTKLSRCSKQQQDRVAKATPATAGTTADALSRALQVPPAGATTEAIRGLARTTSSSPSSGGGSGPCRGSACPPSLRFFRAKPATTNSFFPNVDNAYVSALFRPRRGEVIVVRGKAASSPAGSSPAPWPQDDLDLRYWSLCNNVYRRPWPVVANPLSGGRVDYGCADDDETKVDARGRYAFVVAPESQRTAVKAAGGTFVPYSSTQPNARQVLIFRNMLPNATFTHAVQNVDPDGSPSSAAKAMGAYYPRAYRCTRGQFAGGSRRCG